MTSEYKIRRASADEFPAVRAFYDQLIDDLLQQPYHPMWDKNGHPSSAYLQAALAAGELWVAEAGGELVAAMIVNHEANDGYLEVPWRVEAKPGEFSVIHALGVSLRYQGRGLGAAMLNAVIERARRANEKAVRLDLIDLNLPVSRFYTGFGFYKCSEVKLFYAEVGWQLFHMFEYKL